MKKIVFAVLAVCFLICQNPLQAQVDTIRGKVPYLHYNYYDSTWSKSKLLGDGNMCVVWITNAVNNLYGEVETLGNGASTCFYEDSSSYGHSSSEVAIRMEMDSPAIISGLFFGYTPNLPMLYHVYIPFLDTAIYHTTDYIFNIYDNCMNLIWSDTVATEDLRVDVYMEAGFDANQYYDVVREWHSTGQGGYEAPGYIGLCKIEFDTEVAVPDTFFVGITSTTPLNLDDTTCITTIVLSDGYALSRTYPLGYSGNGIPQETRRYRIAQNDGEQTLNWADEECRNGMQTCLYPILVLPCSDVTNLRYEPVGSTGAIALVQWDGDANHAGYEISYGPQGTPPGEGTVRQVVNHQAVLSQLDRSTRYDVYVRARCDYDTTRWSAWSDTLHMHIATYGIDDVEAPEVTLAPNPTDGRLAVRCEAPITAVALYDLQGRAVLTASGSGTEAVLDLAALPMGTYVLVAHTAQGQVTRTVEKR